MLFSELLDEQSREQRRKNGGSTEAGAAKGIITYQHVLVSQASL
jgi:hypothetical protein